MLLNINVACHESLCLLAQWLYNLRCLTVVWCVEGLFLFPSFPIFQYSKTRQKSVDWVIVPLMKFMRTHSWEMGKRCLLFLIFSYYISHQVLKLNECKKTIHLPTCTFFGNLITIFPKNGYMYTYCAWQNNFAINKAQHYADILLYFHCILLPLR